MKSGGVFRKGQSPGFSLVEMVVVILVLGIIAAIAAPKFFDTTGDARESNTKQNLKVIRDALGMYKVHTGGYPTKNSITTDLQSYIRGPFPSPEFGANRGNPAVKASSKDPIDDPSGPEGWIYSQSTGEFRVNDASCLAW